MLVRLQYTATITLAATTVALLPANRASMRFNTIFPRLVVLTGTALRWPQGLGQGLRAYSNRTGICILSSYLPTYLPTYLSIYLSICLSTYTYTYTYALCRCIYIYAYIYIHTHTCIYIYAYTYTYTYTRTHMHMHVQSSMQTYIPKQRAICTKPYAAILLHFVMPCHDVI